MTLQEEHALAQGAVRTRQKEATVQSCQMRERWERARKRGRGQLLPMTSPRGNAPVTHVLNVLAMLHVI